jgi:hypothetical protein
MNELSWMIYAAGVSGPLVFWAGFMAFATLFTTPIAFAVAHEDRV